MSPAFQPITWLGLPRRWLRSSQRAAQAPSASETSPVVLVEVEGLALAVGLHAQVDRRDRGVAEVGRAEGLGIARPDALDEVLPEGPGVFARLLGD